MKSILVCFFVCLLISANVKANSVIIGETKTIQGVSIVEAIDTIMENYNKNRIDDDILCFIHPACFCYDIVLKNNMPNFKINIKRQTWHFMTCSNLARKKVVNEIVELFRENKFIRIVRCCRGLGCSIRLILT